MDRRELLSILGGGVAGLAALDGATARADHNGHPHDEHIQIISECARVCNEASHHCLGELKKMSPHAESHAKAHQATMDCQAFCTLTAALSAHSSPMATYAHAACADACRDCAKACEGQQDEIMKECITACRNCEKHCRQMTGHNHGPDASRS